MAPLLKGSCHCKTVQFEVSIDTNLDTAIRCNCSLCRRKGAAMYAVSKESLSITQGQDNLGLYQWGTGKAKHYFCKTCGIYTHHQRFIDPNQFSFNLGCIDGLDVESLTIKRVDGASF